MRKLNFFFQFSTILIRIYIVRYLKKKINNTYKSIIFVSGLLLWPEPADRRSTAQWPGLSGLREDWPPGGRLSPQEGSGQQEEGLRQGAAAHTVGEGDLNIDTSERGTGNTSFLHTQKCSSSFNVQELLVSKIWNTIVVLDRIQLFLFVRIRNTWL